MEAHRQHAAAILATPSGQRLLAPTERERALEAALLSLVDDIESIHDALDIDEREWVDIMDRAMGARYMALAAQPDAPEVAS